MVRREHRADARHDDVEGRVLERQVLGVGLRPLQREPLGFGDAAAGLEQLGREVAGGDVRAGLRGADGSVPGSGRDVEHLHPGADAARLDEDRAQRQQEGLDHPRVVARRPHLAMAGLELRIRNA
jgi:hypothetical protein